MMIRNLISHLRSDDLLKDSSVLFAGMAGGHVLNLAFQIVMGRTLPSEEFALLITLLCVLNIFVVPLGVVSSLMNRYVSLLISQSRQGDIFRMILHVGNRMAFLGCVLSLICLFSPDQIARFFHLERSAPIIIFGIILTGVFCRPVIDGALQGMQCFRVWTFNTLLGWGLRLLVGSFLVIYVSSFAGWGLLGHGLGFYAALILGLSYLYCRLRSIESSGLPLPILRGYVAGSFIILLSFAVFMSGDVVLVKHLFPESAADFSYAATLGRIVIFLPQAFIAAMFPKVVSEEKSASNVHLIILYKTLLLTLFSAILCALICSFATECLLQLIFDIESPSMSLILWTRLFVWTMIPIAMLGVSCRFALAQRRFKSVLALPIVAMAYLIYCLNIATDVKDLLAAAATSSLATGILILYLISRRKD